MKQTKVGGESVIINVQQLMHIEGKQTYWYFIKNAQCWTPLSGYFELCARPSVRLSCDDGYYVVTAFPQVFPSEEGRASLCGATESGQENQKERGGNELTSPSLLCAYCIVCTLIRIVAEPTGRHHHYYYYYKFMYTLDISLYHLSYVYTYSLVFPLKKDERER